MKKLMMAIMMAFMTVGAIASTCTACGETASVCRAWNITLNLKTLGAKPTVCKTDESLCGCGETTKETTYYLAKSKRKIKGYLWICDYECGKPFNIVLWDATNKLPIIPVTMEAVDMEQYAMICGKNATEVAVTLPLTNEKIEIALTGTKGKMKRAPGEGGCYISKISGKCLGNIAYVKPGTKEKKTITKGTLCSEPAEEITPATEFNAKALSLCDACCFSSWCGAEDAKDMVPADGTWKMKYNKKVSNGTKSIYQLIPSYAQ